MAYFDLNKTGSDVNLRIDTIKFNGDGTKVLDDTGVYTSVSDSKIGDRTIQNPETDSGQTTGLLTSLLDKFTTAIRVLRGSLQLHIDRIDNPHIVTKTQVGLGNVDNIKQASKTEFDEHKNNSDIHVTPEDKIEWNKISEVYKGEIYMSDLDVTIIGGMYKVNEVGRDSNWLWVASDPADGTYPSWCRQLFFFIGSDALRQRIWYADTGWSAWESYAYTSDLLPILQDIVKLKEEKLNRQDAPNALIGTASGETVTLTDVQPYTNARSLKIYGETTEIGEGEKSPDNPYELQGVENPTVRVSGKNRWGGELENGYIDPTSGSNQGWGSYKRSGYIPIPSNTNYVFACNKPETRAFFAIYYDKNKNYISSHNLVISASPIKRVTPVGTAYTRVTGVVAIMDNLGDKAQLELGTTATPYEPYKPIIEHPTTTPTLYSLPNGVADEVDLVSGLKVNNVGTATLGAGTTWTIPEAVDNSPIICTISNITNLVGKTLTIPEGATEDFTVLYKLATPTTSELSPQTIPLYSPTSVISTDKGSLEVEYNRDINKAIQELTNAIIALGGTIDV